MSLSMILVLIGVVALAVGVLCLARRDYPMAIVLAVVGVLLLVYSGVPTS